MAVLEKRRLRLEELCVTMRVLLPACEFKNLYQVNVDRPAAGLRDLFHRKADLFIPANCNLAPSLAIAVYCISYIDLQTKIELMTHCSVHSEVEEVDMMTSPTNEFREWTSDTDIDLKIEKSLD